MVVVVVVSPVQRITVLVANPKKSESTETSTTFMDRMSLSLGNSP